MKGPNDKIPRPHLYVTMKRGKKKSKVLKEIEEVFECGPKKYFELFREPKRKPKFKYSSKPTSGGGIVVVSKDNDDSPLKVLDQRVDEGSGDLRASGTLTMFCSQNDNHYTHSLAFTSAVSLMNNVFTKRLNTKSLSIFRNRWKDTRATLEKNESIIIRTRIMKALTKITTLSHPTTSILGSFPSVAFIVN